jgi:D-methionine transport system permease protein
LLEAVQAMGGTRWTIVRKVLLPEALPGLIAGLTVTLVTLVGRLPRRARSALADFGDLARRYGHQRFETSVMIAIVAVLIVLVRGLQLIGDRLTKAGDHRA